MIFLQKMSKLNFDNYLLYAINEYAKDKVTSRKWNETEAEKLSRKVFLELLPKGLETKDNFLFNLISDCGQIVGILWLKSVADGANKLFIYDFEIHESKRKMGYGRQALAALFEFSKQNDVEQIDLHVFAHNEAAIGLYEKLGFIATDISMSKFLR